MEEWNWELFERKIKEPVMSDARCTVPYIFHLLEELKNVQEVFSDCGASDSDVESKLQHCVWNIYNGVQFKIPTSPCSFSLDGDDLDGYALFHWMRDSFLCTYCFYKILTNLQRAVGLGGIKDKAGEFSYHDVTLEDKIERWCWRVDANPRLPIVNPRTGKFE